MIVSYSFLFGIEANALTDDSGLRTGGAPNREGHLEADCEDPLAGFACTRAEGMLAGKLIGGSAALMLWRDITSHI